jgi:hypothetical protein
MARDVTGTLTYPVAGETAERPLLLGWILVLLGSLVPVFPQVVFLGYLVRVLASSASGAESPPSVGAVPALVRRGAGGTAIAVAYLALPAVVLAVTFRGITGSPRVPNGLAGTLVFSAGTTTVLCLALLSSYLLPIALTVYGREGRVRAAFETGQLRVLATAGAVFVGWTVALVLVAAGAALARVVVDVARLGPVLAALLVAYTAIVACHRIGISIARAER